VDWATISCFLWKPWKYSISKKKKYNRMYFSYHPMNQPNHYQCSQHNSAFSVDLYQMPKSIAPLTYLSSHLAAL
jgi:hypothetical protein